MKDIYCLKEIEQIKNIKNVKTTRIFCEDSFLIKINANFAAVN